MIIEDIARICHEVNRAYCQAIGDESQPPWREAPEWQKKSAIKGVVFHLQNPNASPSHSHDEWLAEKRKEGWAYGAVKDPENKQHPCFLPYDQLPKEQQLKDSLFKGVVSALEHFLFLGEMVNIWAPPASPK